MAEEYSYASAAGDSHKRKYDDSPSPVARRGTGFSMAPDAAAPPPSYGSVPPPMNEIELAKQKAQEIAARLLNNADPSKRARVENGGGGGGGFDSSDYGGQKTFGLGHSNPPPMASSGYPGSKKIEIPNGRVGVIIGKGGETIKYLQQQSGSKIQVTRDTDSDPNSSTRGVELMGTPDQIARAEQLITDVLAEAEAGSSGGGSRRLSGQPGAEQFVMKVPNSKVGLVIGKGGETIKNMQARTGARIQVIPLHLPPGDTSNERTVQIDGTSEQIEAAKQLVEEVISENRMRNSSMSGGGYRQQGYQARPPTNWGQPPPMQQPGYGYSQAGPYPGQTPQYPMNQPPYPGYPPQPASAGYPTGWDQSTAPANTQGAPGSTTYDYYNQQQPPQQQQQPHGNQGAPDASGYNYGQAPQYSYSQDGYGGYHAVQSGYGQPSNPGSAYDQQQQQQQQGYNSAYGSTTAASNPPTDGNNPQSYVAAQGEANQGAGYPPSSQGGYGTSAGYGNYGQKPQQSPQSGYPAAYGGQSYPGGYGQQQYGGYYSGGGGGYSQQGNDGSAAGGGSGGYEGGAAAQGGAETSPPS